MKIRMFCNQCQETFRNSGCTNAGVCGKKVETAYLMDELIWQLKIISLTGKPSKDLLRFIIRSLFMTITNTNFDDTALQKQLEKAVKLSGKNKKNFPSGVFFSENQDVRSLRSLILFGLKGIAAYAEHAAVLGFEDEEIYQFIFKALQTVAAEENRENLASVVMETGSIAVKTMALLDRANTASFGNPQFTTVRTGVGKRPGILVSGHDLLDLIELLEQSRDSGIDIYTHGEMLPAHYYPALKKYDHLYGNYGNSWHQQKKEFSAFNGPILMTTNCIVPVDESYRQRIFTTGMAGYPGVVHIPETKDGAPKDFSGIIELAKHSSPPQELENGSLTGGFGHAQFLSLADKITDAVKSGAIRRFIVMAGCDGRQKVRSYYTEVAQKIPENTVILTAGCAKYRYQKLISGEICGIPRVLDAGQCNDSYSLIVAALKLKDLLGVDDINDLPLSFDIAWYEQKAVAILLALLSLGFKNIRLGPALPAFLSPHVAEILMEAFDLKCIAEPEEDVAAMLSGK